jgi:hypothetical protein
MSKDQSDLELGTWNCFCSVSKLKNDNLRKIIGQLKAAFGHFIVKYLSSSSKKASKTND